MSRSILDFKMQAEQMLSIIESRLKIGQKESATQILILKFKSLYEQGVANGRIYEREGISPFMDADNPWEN
ncbi:MAG: hypothetical protein JWM09_1031 [Francisellaceae bacterium]|nr:hypothetical protein [Francisellaceae bacterium]